MIPKFRAWDTMHRQWAVPFFIFSEGGLFTPDYGFKGKRHRRTNVYPIVKQERFILMQSTRLFDKNGVEIFEGDVVNAYDLDRDEGRIFKTVDLVGVVEYKGISFCLKDDRGIYNDLWINAEEYEVIGNIHEHPHLLEAIDGH